MNKTVKVLACLVAVMLVVSFGACSKAEDKVKEVEGDVVAEFGKLIDAAKTELATLKAEAEKIEHAGIADVKTGITAVEDELGKAKDALVSEEESAKTAAKDALAKAETELGTLKTKVEALGDDASEEMKKALTAVEDGFAKLKAHL